jgi:two-component system heavy metal sensor histidine kinase CusS
MRTPLSNLRGATEVALSRTRIAEEYEALLASNLEECDRLSRMIESVMFLARAEHPQFVMHMKSFDAHFELTCVAQYFEGLADDAGVRVRVTGDGTLHADVELFRRAVSNLLANAIRHTPRGMAIELRAERIANALRVTVANEGSRIEPDALERVFDRFYRADSSRHHAPIGPPSTGLGLAIVRTVMELHGGRAYVQSDANGTRFILEFPLST